MGKPCRSWAADSNFMSTKMTMNVSGEWVSAIPLHNDRKYSDFPDPDVPITTEWKPYPPKSLARRITYCSSPPCLTPTGTIAHFGSPRPRLSAHSRSTSSSRGSLMPKARNSSPP